MIISGLKKLKFWLYFNQSGKPIGGLLVLAWLSLTLGACSEAVATPTPPGPTSTANPAPATLTIANTEGPTPSLSGPTLAPTLTPAATTTAEADPVRSLPPVNTLPPFTTAPLPENTARPTLSGPQNTPARILNPRAAPFGTDAALALPKGSFVVGTNTGLYVLDRQGENERLLAGGTAFSLPKVAPNGKIVAAFRIDRLTRQSGPVLVDTAGNLKPLTLDNGGVILAMAWSPDAKTLALTRVSDTNNDGAADAYDAATIVLYDPASGKGQSVAEGRFPAWSPDGVRLAYLTNSVVGDDLDPTTRQLWLGPNAVAIYNFTNRGKRTLLEAKGLEVTLGLAGFTPIPPDLKLAVRYFKAVSWHPDSLHVTATADLNGPNGLRAGAVLTATLENATPQVVTAAGDAAGRVAWAENGKGLVFETLPQFPVGPLSLRALALPTETGPATTSPTKTLLGNPATRNEAYAPGWLADGSLAFLEGDRATLTVAGPGGQSPHPILSDCNGFDWY